MQPFIDFSIHHWELWLAFIVALGLFLSFELRNKLTGVPQLSPQDVTLLINRDEAAILDIRDKNSFVKGHIINSINIPLDQLNDRLKQLENYKQKALVLVSATGQSHLKAVSLLQTNGFINIKLLNGGIGAWQSSSLPLKKG